MNSNTTGGAPPTDENGELIPQDAAVLIILDTNDTDARVLMGLRNAELVFMPNKLVFPGGRVDPEDHSVDVVDTLSDRDASMLLQKTNSFSHAAELKALGLAAIRETFEETGVLVGEQTEGVKEHPSALWNDFYAHGVLPSLSHLRFCARAITPANRVRRYDTRFFCVTADKIAKTTEFEPGELDEIKWLSIDEAFQSGLATITEVVLREVHRGLREGSLFDNRFDIPFYYAEDGVFHREILGSAQIEITGPVPTQETAD